MNNKNRVTTTRTAIATLCMVGLTGPALAQEGGRVIEGDGSIDTNGSTTTITQRTQNLVIDWETFNIAADERVVFDQPNAQSAALNRIFDQNPSQIFGAIDANGRVFLFNPNGVIFGASAKVSVAAMVASSLEISVDDFLAGNYDFNEVAGQTGGLVVNRGLIEAATGGSVVLIGGSVENEGVILAEFGDVAMGAGSSVSLDFDGDGLLFFEVTGDVISNADNRESAVSNSGEITGGQVVLAGSTARDVFSNVVNNSGIVQAQGIENEGGVIRLVGSGGDVYTSGTLDASSSSGDGGSIHVLGDRVAVMDGATITASGAGAGGEILVGGSYQGSDPNIKNAQRTYVGSGANLTADGGTGDGGTVIVWSDELTRHHGHVSARSEQGAGGFAEVSGKDTLIYRGTSDLSGPEGNGTLLLDPRNVTIADIPPSPDDDSTNIDGDGSEGTDPFRANAAGSPVTLDTDAVESALATANVHITTTNTGTPGAEAGDITVDGTIVAPNNSSDLTLEAHNDIILTSNADIDFATNSSTGDVVLYADLDDSPSPGDEGAIIADAASIIRMGGGNLQLRAGDGIGTAVNPINVTGLTGLAAETELNGVYVDNTGGTTINVTSVTTGVAGATSGIAAGGDVIITNDGGITVSQAVTSGGDVTLVTDVGNLTVNADITAEAAAGDITLQTSTTGNIVVDANTTAGNTTGTTVLDAAGSISGSGVITSTDATLTAGANIGSISDIATGAGAAVQVAASNSITASTSAAGSQINLDVSGSSSTAVGANSITVGGAEAASAIIQSSTNIDLTAGAPFVATAGDDIALRAGGTLTIPAVGLSYATANLFLSGGTDIIDAGVTPRNLDLVADALTVESGSAGGSTTLTTDVSSLTATIGGTASLTVNENDAVTLADVDTADGSITVAAGGTVTATDVVAGGASNDVIISATTGDILLGAVTATGQADIQANAGSILDNNGTAVNVTADDLFMSAQDEIGTITTFANGSGDAIEVNIGTFVSGLSTTAANSTINIDVGDSTPQLGTNAIEAGTAVVGSIIIQSQNDVDLSATADPFVESAGDNIGILAGRDGTGTLTIPSVGLSYATTNLLLSGGTDVVDAALTRTLTLDADNLTFDSGSAGGNTTLATNVNTINASLNNSGAARNLVISEGNGIDLVDVDTADGAITVIAAAGNIVATDVQSLTDSDTNDVTITASAGAVEVGTVFAAGAGDVTVTANTDVTDSDSNASIAGNDVVVTATTGDLEVRTVTGSGAVTLTADNNVTDADSNAVVTGNGVSVTATNGNLEVGTVTGSGGSDVTLTAGGNITDADANSDVSGNDGIFTAGGAIGASGLGLAIDTNLDTLDASAGASGGGVYILESNAIDLIDVDTVDGEVVVTATGTITATDVVSADAGADQAHDVTLTSIAGNIDLDVVTADNEADLSADAGSILDINGTANNITAVDLDLSAQDNIGDIIDFNAGTGDPIDVNISGTINNVSTSVVNSEINLNLGNSTATVAAGAIDPGSNAFFANAILQSPDDLNFASAANGFTTSAGDGIGLIAGTDGTGTLTLPGAGLNLPTVDLLLSGATDVVDDDAGAAARILNINADTLSVISGVAGGDTTLITSVNELNVNLQNAANLVVTEANGARLDDVQTDNGTITVTSTAGNLEVDSVNAGDGAGGVSNVSITASLGSLTDGDSNSSVTGDEVTLTGQTGVGTQANPIQTTANTLIGSAVASGELAVTESDGLRVQSATTTGAGDIVIIVQNGNLEVDTVNANGGANNATLEATNGDIRDADDNSLVTANLATMTSASGIGIFNNNPINTTVTSLDATVTGTGGIDINETSTIDLLDVDTNNGSIRVVAGDSIRATDVESTNGLDANDITLISTTGNIEVDRIIAAGAADVTLTSQDGQIEDTDTNSTVTADAATLDADTGIGGLNGANPINLSATTITASNLVSGDISLDNTQAGAVTVASAVNDGGDVLIDNTGVGGVTYEVVDATGNVLLTSDNGDLTVGTLVEANSDVVLATTSGGGVLLNGTTTSLGGDVTITASGAILNGGAVTANGNATLTGLTITETDVTATTGAATQVAAGDLEVGRVAGNTVSLTSQNGAIINEVDPVNSLIFSATTTTLNAEDGIGDDSGDAGVTEAILTATPTLIATTDSAGDINVRQVAGDINLQNVTTADGAITVTAVNSITATNVVSTTDADANDILLETSAGNIEVGTVNAGNTAGDVTMTATNGAILDNNGDSAVTADVLTMTAQGLIGSLINPINTDINTLDASSTSSGGIFINETDEIDLADVDTADGTIDVVAGGQITATDVESLTDNDGNDVVLTASTGGIEIGRIFAAGAADVTLTAITGNISELGTDAAADVEANDIQLVAAAGGIGLGNAIETTTSAALSLQSGGAAAAGDINVVETNPVNTDDITIQTDALSAQSVSITADQITVGSIDLGDAGDNLSLTAATGTIEGGSARLVANELTLTADDPTNGRIGDTVQPVLTTAATLNVSTTGSATVSESDGVDLASVDVDGNFNLTTAGTITDSGTIDVDGVATFAAGNANDILLDEVTNDFGTVTVTSASNVQVEDANALTLDGVDAQGNVAVNAVTGLTQTDLVQAATGNITLTTGGDMSAAGASAGGSYIATAGGSLTTSGTVTAANSIAMTAQTGSATLGGDAAAGGALTVNAATDITQTGNLSSAAGDITLTAGGNIAASNATATAGSYSADAGASLTTTGAISAGTNVSLTAGAGLDTSAGSVTSGANTTMAASNGDAVLGATSATGNLAVTATGDINQAAGIVTVGGTTDLNAVNGNNITLGNASNAMAGTVTINSANNAVTLANDGNLTVGSGQTIASLDLTSTSGSVQQATALTVTGDTAADAGVNVDLSNAGNSFGGSVSLTSVADASVTDSTALELAASNVGGNLAATSSGGDITDSGDIVVTGESTFTASQAGSSIILDSSGNNFGGDVDFLPADGTLNNVTVVDNSEFELQNGLDIGGNLNVTAVGAVTQEAGGITVDGTTTISAGTNAIALADADNDFVGAVSLSNAGNNNVAINDTNDLVLGTSNVGIGTLSVTADDNITQAGAVTQGPIAGDATFVAGAGAVTLDNAANDFTGDVLVTAGTDATVVDANDLAVHGTAGGSFTATAGGDLTSSTITSGSQTTLVAAGDIAAGAVTAGGDYTATADGSVTQGGVASSGGDATIVANGGDATVSANVTAVNNLTVSASGSIAQTGALTADTGNITLDATVNIDASNATATAGDYTANAGGAYAQTNGTSLNAAGAVSISSGGDATLRDATAGGDYTVAAGGAVNHASGAIDSGGTIDIDAAGGDVTVQSLTAASNVELDASANINQAGDVTATAGDILLTAGNNIDAGNATAPAGDYTADAGGSFTQRSGTTIDANDINIATGGDMTIADLTSDGNVNASSDGGVRQIGDILTSGGIVAISAVTGIEMEASTRTDSTGGDISYVSTGTGDVVIALLNAGSDGPVTGDALGSPVDPGTSGSVAVRAGTNGSSILSAFTGSDGVNVRGQSTSLEALTGEVGTVAAPMVLIITPDPNGDVVIDINSASVPVFLNPLFAQVSESSLAGDITQRGANTATAASVQSALEQIGFVDWAGLDPDVRLVDCLEPCLKLPADQVEDDGLSQLFREPTKMIVIQTVNGIKLIPVYTTFDATIASSEPRTGGLSRN